MTLHDILRAARISAVRGAIERNRGNMAATARELGISRSYLYTLVNTYRG